MRALKRWIAAVAVVALVIGTGVSMQCVTVSALSEEIQAQQTTEEQTSDPDAEKNPATEKQIPSRRKNRKANLRVRTRKTIRSIRQEMRLRQQKGKLLKATAIRFSLKRKKGGPAVSQ